jgi:hypothetical protein
MIEGRSFGHQTRRRILPYSIWHLAHILNE